MVGIEAANTDARVGKRPDTKTSEIGIVVGVAVVALGTRFPEAIRPITTMSGESTLAAETTEQSMENLVLAMTHERVAAPNLARETLEVTILMETTMTT